MGRRTTGKVYGVYYKTRIVLVLKEMFNCYIVKLLTIEQLANKVSDNNATI